MQRKHAEGAAATATAAASSPPPRSHAHAHLRPRAPPTRASCLPGPALTLHRLPGGSRGVPGGGGAPPLRGGGAGCGGRGGGAPRSNLPARWGRWRVPGLPGRPRGDGRGNGSFRRRSRRCSRCPGPPPLLGDRCCRGRLCHEPRRPETARETQEGARGPPETNRASHYPLGAEPPRAKPRRERGAAAPPNRGGALDSNAPQRSDDLSWARASIAPADTFADPGP